MHTITSNICLSDTKRTSAAEFTIHSSRDPFTGEDHICAVASTEQDYFALEKHAQRRGKTVEQYLYAEMIGTLAAHGFNTPPNCFSVTAGMPGQPAPAASTPLYN
jgi:hypothetical protein